MDTTTADPPPDTTSIVPYDPGAARKRTWLQTWEMLALLIPLTALAVIGGWKHRDVWVDTVEEAVSLVGGYLGWSLAPYFGFLFLMLVAGVAMLLRERRQRVPLTAYGVLEFVREASPAAGFLGTAIGLLLCLESPEDLSGFAMALGTTVVGLTMPLVAQTLQLFLCPAYRRELNGEEPRPGGDR